MTVEAADLHPARQHSTRSPDDAGGWVGVDRGLSAFLVAATADGTEVARVTDAPNALTTGMLTQRRLARSLSRKQRASRNRTNAAARLAAITSVSPDVRRHSLHRVSNEVVNTHDRVVLEAEGGEHADRSPTSARSPMPAGRSSPGC